MKILIVEDDLKIANFIKKGLKEAGFSAEIVSDGLEALAKILNEEFDLFIIDLMLPRLDGFSLIEIVRQKGITTPILVLSARRAVEDRVRGLEIGSDDYLVKPFAFEELIARIHALLRRKTAFQRNASYLKVADLELDLLKREARRGGKRIELSNKEFQILEYLMRNAGRILTRTQILSHVWGYQFDPSTNIVEVHICRLREKIDKGFPKKLIRTVRGAGYVLSSD